MRLETADPVYSFFRETLHSGRITRQQYVLYDGRISSLWTLQRDFGLQRQEERRSLNRISPSKHGLLLDGFLKVLVGATVTCR